MRFLISAFAVLLVGFACSVPTSTSTLTATPTPTTPVMITPSPTAPLGTSAELETLRRLAFDYWAAFNSYNVENVLAYLEDSYRLERDSEIRQDLGRLKLFRVKLGVSEETPPQMTGPNEGEIFLLMKEPLGTRRIKMAFRKLDGTWKITYAEEVQ